jgi:putative ABC transport system permease protein
MFALSAFQMATRQIARHAMRSTLTTLGIVIGTASVIAMVSLGNGATARISNDIARLGKNMLLVMPGTTRRGPGGVSTAPPLELDDVHAVAKEVGGVAAVAPTSGSVALAVLGNLNWRTQLTGTDRGFFQIRSWGVQRGRLFSDAEERAGTPVCLLGATVKENIFGAQDPLGSSIRLGTFNCQVIGIMEAKGRSTFGDDQDDIIIMPIVAFQRRSAGTADVGLIMVSAVDGVPTSQVQRDITALMRQRRRISDGKEDDFNVRDMKEISELADRTTGILTTLLAAIAAISLLVGGIGIMNIMLVSVTERTREIGIRLAVGARESEVLLQFLIEAMVLSMLGGVIGIVLGLGGSAAASIPLGIPFLVDGPIVGLAFGVSALVGIAFGFFPARKAAHLNPIDALHFE